MIIAAFKAGVPLVYAWHFSTRLGAVVKSEVVGKKVRLFMATKSDGDSTFDKISFCDIRQLCGKMNVQL